MLAAQRWRAFRGAGGRGFMLWRAGDNIFCWWRIGCPSVLGAATGGVYCGGRGAKAGGGCPHPMMLPENLPFADS